MALKKVVPGAGLVFRFANTFNYWSIEAAPKFATWNILKVIDNQRSSLGNLGVAPVAGGTIVEVLTRGPQIEVLVNGVRPKTLTDSALKDAPSVGLIVSGRRAGEARWNGFAASVQSDEPNAPEPTSSVPAPSSS